eukprot:m.17035 g.17035  ORF g.17035 m.17035 type:complete len:66 (+) comp10911_c0_seq1:461-658(+)
MFCSLFKIKFFGLCFLFSDSEFSVNPFLLGFFSFVFVLFSLFEKPLSLFARWVGSKTPQHRCFEL